MGRVSTSEQSRGGTLCLSARGSSSAVEFRLFRVAGRVAGELCLNTDWRNENH